MCWDRSSLSVPSFRRVTVISTSAVPSDQCPTALDSALRTGLTTGTGVLVGVGVLVGNGVEIGVGSGVGVDVGMLVAVGMGVWVSVDVGALVAVEMGVWVGVDVGVSVSVGAGVGVTVADGVGVSDGGPSLHAARVVAMRAANKPARMARRTPVQRLSSIGNISMSRRRGARALRRSPRRG